MYKLKYIFIFIIAFAFSSCSTDQVEIALGIADPIEVTVSETSLQDPVTRATLAGPVTYFESGDAIGIFVVDKSGNVVKSNVKYTYNGTSWNPESGAAITYSRDHKYYAYYPYTASVAGAPTSSTAYKDYPSADVVLKNLASSWTVQSDQSTKANYKKSDLMTAAYKGTGVDNNAVVFQMTHKMGLATFALKSKTISGQKYHLDSDPTYTWTYSTVTFTSSDNFTAGIPYLYNSKYYRIVRPSTNTTISAAKSTTVDDTYDWSFTVNVSSSKYKDYTLPDPSFDAQTSLTYTLQDGDILYSDGAVSRSEAEGVFSDKNAIGIVFTTKTSAADQARGWTHGYAIALNNAGMAYWGPDGVAPVEGRTNPDGFKDLEGYDETVKLVNNGNYPAATMAWNYKAKTKSGGTISSMSSKLSHWFLPSAGQMYVFLTDFGGLEKTPATIDNEYTSRWSEGSATILMDALNKRMKKMADAAGYDIDYLIKSLGSGDAFFWCSTPSSRDISGVVKAQDGTEHTGLCTAFKTQFWDDNAIWFDNVGNGWDDLRHCLCKVRPFIAF